MTIKGFIDFLNSRPELRGPIQLHRTRLLMDGHFLQRQLYVFASKVDKDFKYCTDYCSYAEFIKSFLRRLKICGIVPIVVFHGDVDPKKYSQAFNARIGDIRWTHKGDYKRIPFQSPTLLNYVFNSIMREFKVDVIQTCSATWPQVAMLANALKCPVFSARRDFFFLDVKYGIIYDESFLKSRLHYNNKDNSWFLPAKVLRVDCLSKTYVGLKPEVLPLLAVVWEESLISEKGYQYLLEKTRQCGRITEKMDDILNWIRGKSVDKALEEITVYLKSSEEGNENVDQKIKNLMKRFEATDSLISKYLKDSDSDKDSLRMLGKGDIEVVVPNWFAREYRRGIIRPAIMNIVKLKTHVLYPQCEDYDQPSSYEHTIKLRRFLYGLLRTETENPHKIKVLDRKHVQRLEEYVTPLDHLANNQKMPFLANLRILEVSERRELFLSVMEVSESFINRCKVTLLMSDYFDNICDISGTTYLIICLRYCIRHNRQQDWWPFIGAVVLCVMFYGRREVKADEKWRSLYKVDRQRRYDPTLVHFFAQLQACLHMSNFINIVLGFPYDEGKPYFCLDGIFLNNATESLSDEKTSEELLDYLFDGRRPMADVFDDMFDLVVLELNV